MAQLKEIFPQGSIDDPKWATAAQIRTQLTNIDKMRIDPVTGGVGVSSEAAAAYIFDLNRRIKDPNAFLSEEGIQSALDRFSSNEYVYGAYRQPSWDNYETQAAALRGGSKAYTVADGRRAISLLLSTLPQGAHIIVTPEEVYSGTFKMFMQTLAHSKSLEVDYVDDATEANLKAKLKPNTVMVFSETWSNPRMSVADLATISKFTKEHGLICVVDNTIATLLVRPLANGADIELTSLTKHDSNQNDVLGGLLVLSDDSESIVNRPDDLMKLLKIDNPELRAGIESAGYLGYHRNVEGGTMAVDVCNALYGRLTSIPGHMETISENGMEIAEWAQDQKGIDHVYYPGLESHPGHDIASQYARGFGGLVTFVTHGDRYDAIKFAVGLEAAGIYYFDSWGGQMPNAVLVGEQTSRYKAMSEEELDQIGMKRNTCRFFAGAGDPEFCKEGILSGLRASFRPTAFPAAVAPAEEAEKSVLAPAGTGDLVFGMK